jgi:lipopolysaccharide/colanic/teichoic acid biosynthesis glycosyltransferase
MSIISKEGFRSESDMRYTPCCADAFQIVQPDPGITACEQLTDRLGTDGLCRGVVMDLRVKRRWIKRCDWNRVNNPRRSEGLEEL